MRKIFNDCEETRKTVNYFYCIFENNLKSIHNKDYSVVKTFKAALYVFIMSLSLYFGFVKLIFLVDYGFIAIH
jgi:hypothetical protein